MADALTREQIDAIASGATVTTPEHVEALIAMARAGMNYRARFEDIHFNLTYTINRCRNAESVLRSLEWAERGHNGCACPSCHGLEVDGHRDGCKLHEALEASRG